jgi:hypothetical protein
MTFNGSLRFRSFTILAVWGCLAAVPPTVCSQHLPRWRFEEGQQYRIVTTQHVAMEARAEAKSFRMTHRIAIQLAWKVAGVDEKGIADIDESIERLEVRWQAPGMDELVYDSGADEPPAPAAKPLADVLQPLLAVRARHRLTARGETVETRLLGGETAESPPRSKGTQQFSQFLTAAGLRELSGAAFLALPAEPVRLQGSWSVARPAQIPAGKFDRQITYRLAGEEVRDGVGLTRIDLSWTLKPAVEKPTPLLGDAPTGPGLRITKQDNEGVILFAAKAGYPVEIRLRQDLQFDAGLGEGATPPRVVSETKVRFTRL